MRYQAVGYHATTTEQAAQIRKDGFDLDRAEKNSFLGPGVYFWDNSRARAEHWIQERDLVPGEVIEATIDLSNFLDLTTQEGRDFYARFVRQTLATESGAELYGKKELDDDAFFLDTLYEMSSGAISGFRAMIMRRKQGFNQRADLLHEKKELRDKLDRSRIVTNFDIVICVRDLKVLSL